MKNALHSLVLLSAFCLVGCGGQQSSPASESSSSAKQTVPTSSIEETVEEFNNALVKRDQAGLERLCADGLSYGHSSGLAQDKQTFINDAVNGPFQFLSIRTEDQQIALSDDMAIVRHTFLADAVNKGDSVQVRIGNAQLYKLYADGQWRLVMRQAYKL